MPQKARILLVDDRAENLIALEAILSSLNQELVPVRSGEAALKALPDIRDAAVLDFPDRESRTGLYAFIEAGEALQEEAVRKALAAAVGANKLPEFLQVVEALPRNENGEIRSEILELVALNQLDLIDPLIRSETERAVVSRIVSQRRNLRDRFAF